MEIESEKPSRFALRGLSVVVPVAWGDRAWLSLIPDLALLPMDAEILFVCPELPIDAPQLISKHLSPGRKVRWLKSAAGRAIQMNVGAREATKKFIWFVHADTRLKAGCLSALETAMIENPNAILYANLIFMTDGPSFTSLNTFGVWLRSHLFKMPFGDQSFCLTKENFERLGGYVEDCRYGEDHLLIWKARQMGRRVRCTGGSVFTSARKYQEQGWATTTLRHLYMTAVQAIPEAIKLVASKFTPSPSAILLKRSK